MTEAMLDVKLQIFLLVLARTSAALLSVPVLTDHGVPAPARVGLSALLSFLVLPAASAAFSAPIGAAQMIASTMAELGIGLFIGLVVTMVFEAVAIAFKVIETQAGFSLGSSISPMSGGAHSSFGNFYRAASLILFFSSGAYREMLRGLASTFMTLPVGRLALSGAHGESSFLVSAGSHMFVAAVHFGAPIACGILLADVALGLLSRAAPQMNIFAVGFPVKIAVALIMALASFPLFAAAFSREMHSTLSRLFGAAGGF